MIRTAIHHLAHRLGCNVGALFLLKRDGRIYRAFRCDRCGAIQHEREVTRDEARRLALIFGDRWEFGPGPVATRKGGPHARS